MRDSAFPTVIRCRHYGCPATVASLGPELTQDDLTVRHLRNAGWAVAEGDWVCGVHAPDDPRKHRKNPHCSNCGDLRGGAYGHDVHECTWATAS